MLIYCLGEIDCCAALSRRNQQVGKSLWVATGKRLWVVRIVCLARRPKRARLHWLYIGSISALYRLHIALCRYRRPRVHCAGMDASVLERTASAERFPTRHTARRPAQLGRHCLHAPFLAVHQPRRNVAWGGCNGKRLGGVKVLPFAKTTSRRTLPRATSAQGHIGPGPHRPRATSA